MEFFVTMVTHVPEGKSTAAVDEVKDQEAAHSRELADAGRLLRLWRPPLLPGEWRTLGLFDARDEATLDTVLRGMPLRIWRTDDVVPLSPHPDDPGRRSAGPGPSPRDAGPEFFTTFHVTYPVDASDEDIAEMEKREAVRAMQLADQGLLQRLWTLPGDGRTLGLWEAGDAALMQNIVEALPLRPWFSVEIVPLSPHPGDPAAAAD